MKKFAAFLSHMAPPREGKRIPELDNKLSSVAQGTGPSAGGKTPTIIPLKSTSRKKKSETVPWPTILLERPVRKRFDSADHELEKFVAPVI